MPHIFISYRRQDSQDFTGRIYDRLAAAFGEKNIFRDVDNIPVGQDFRAVLEHETGKCEVLLIIIGPKWLNIRDQNGERRLDNPNDFVRIEVEAGLKRPDLLIIPVLINNAPMPQASDLPESLQELAYRNAAVVRQDPDFRGDMEKLARQIKLSRSSALSPAKKYAPVGFALFLIMIAIAGLTSFIKSGSPQAAEAATSLPATPSETAQSVTVTETATPALPGTVTLTDEPLVSLSGPMIANCPVFPVDNFWNTPIDTLPVHPNSATWIDRIGRQANFFFMSFGSGTWEGGPIGIPFNVISGANATKYSPDFSYWDESDPGPYPIPAAPKIEWGADHHLLAIDTDTCTLYEIYAASFKDGKWSGDSGAIWNLNSNALRPDRWTSTDAAGLPVLPGLVRYDEVAAGEIKHALRFTAPSTAGYIWPARHQTAKAQEGIPPLGARFRLKADYDLSRFPPEAQVLLKAMKTYGIVLADNGSTWNVHGAPDERWDNTVLQQLGALTGNDFEAVDTSVLMVDPNSAQVK